jgi:pre-rRNA-processing protein TSR3
MIRIYVIRYDGDDPKKSTGLKLVRLGYAIRADLRRISRKTIILNPFSKKVLTPADRDLIAKYGIAVIDTSWNTGIETLKKLSRLRRESRILPILFAGNPINYGIATKLSSVEAVAAALYITGFKDQARGILNTVKWGHTFIELNKELLERYSLARSPEEVIKIQNEVINKIKKAGSS